MCEFEAGDIECLCIHSSGWMSVRKEIEELSVPRRGDVDLRRDVSEANRGDEEVLGRYGFKERTAEGHIVVDLAKRMKMAAGTTHLRKREEHRVMYKSGGTAHRWNTSLQKVQCAGELAGKPTDISPEPTLPNTSQLRQQSYSILRSSTHPPAPGSRRKLSSVLLPTNRI